MTDEQKSEFVKIQTNMDADGVVDRSFKVTKVNGDVVMTEGRLNCGRCIWKGCENLLHGIRRW